MQGKGSEANCKLTKVLFWLPVVPCGLNQSVMKPNWNGSHVSHFATTPIYTPG